MIGLREGVKKAISSHKNMLHPDGTLLCILRTKINYEKRGHRRGGRRKEDHIE